MPTDPRTHAALRLLQVLASTRPTRGQRQRCDQRFAAELDQRQRTSAHRG